MTSVIINTVIINNIINIITITCSCCCCCYRTNQQLHILSFHVMAEMSTLTGPSFAGETVSSGHWMYGAHITSDWRKWSSQIALPVSYYSVREIPGLTTRNATRVHINIISIMINVLLRRKKQLHSGSCSSCKTELSIRQSGSSTRVATCGSTH